MFLMQMKLYSGTKAENPVYLLIAEKEQKCIRKQSQILTCYYWDKAEHPEDFSTNGGRPRGKQSKQTLQKT